METYAQAERIPKASDMVAHKTRTDCRRGQVVEVLDVRESEFKMGDVVVWWRKAAYPVYEWSADLCPDERQEAK